LGSRVIQCSVEHPAAYADFCFQCAPLFENFGRKSYGGAKRYFKAIVPDTQCLDRNTKVTTLLRIRNVRKGQVFSVEQM